MSYNHRKEENTMSDRPIKLEELAVMVGVSVKTINNWYAWKKENPDHELAKLLPDYTQHGERQTRYWKQSDVWSVAKFKASLPQGRGGILGSVTQKYYHKGKQKKEKN